MAGEYEKQKEEIKKKAISGVTGGLFDPSSGLRSVLREAGDYWGKELRGETAGGIPVPGYGARVAARTKPSVAAIGVSPVAPTTPVPAVAPSIVPTPEEQERLTHWGASAKSEDISSPTPGMEEWIKGNIGKTLKTQPDALIGSGLVEKGTSFGVNWKPGAPVFTNKSLEMITGSDPTKTGPTPEEMTAILAKRDAENAAAAQGLGVSGKGVTFEDLINTGFNAGNEARATKKAAGAAAINASNADIEYKKGMLGVAQKGKPKKDISGDIIRAYTDYSTSTEKPLPFQEWFKQFERDDSGEAEGNETYSQDTILAEIKRRGLNK